MDKLEYEALGQKIVHAAFEVHKELGPGLLETVYEFCLIEELKSKGIKIQNQIRIPLTYKGIETGKDFILDILVEDEIILELKALEFVLPVHEVQLLTYMKLTNKKLGYLINFNVPLIKDGIKRKINGYL